jgi:hypothetical protein
MYPPVIAYTALILAAPPPPFADAASTCKIYVQSRSNDRSNVIDQ